MFKIKYIRNILILSLAVAVMFPLYNVQFVYPELVDILTKKTEDEALRTATHIYETNLSDRVVVDGDFILKRKEVFEAVKGHFNLFKLKLFDPSGVVLYSTFPGDIGAKTTKPHFYEVVAKGKNYSKLKKKNIVTPEGKDMEIDVVAAYIPLMEDGRFNGAFEIYYDVTARKKKIFSLILRSSLLMVSLSLLFMTLVTLAGNRAKNHLYERFKAEDELKKHRDNLENTVRDRTAELYSANERLKREMKERMHAKEKIELAKNDWEHTFDTITDMITIVDRDHNIVQANRAARESCALPAPDEGERKCFGYYPGMEKPAGGSLDMVGLDKGETRSVELFEPVRDRYLEVRTMVRNSGTNDFTGMIHVVRDITPRKHAEENLQLQVKRLGVLNSIEKAITSILDLNTILDILVEQVTSKLGLDAGNVLLYREPSQMLEFVVNKGFRSEALKFTRLRLGEGTAGMAALKRTVFMIPDLKKDSGEFSRSELFDGEDFVSYYGIPLIARGKIMGVLELFNRSKLTHGPDFEEFLETIGNQAAVAIDNATLFDELERSNIEISLAYDKTIEGWSRAMDMRDHETEGHSERVSDMTYRIARNFKISEEKLVHIRRGALLHDMGKMAIPDSILLKPGKLSDDEWKVMRRHPEYGYQMLSEIEFLREALDIPLYHHEKWDGTGYPRGLRGEEIPIAARIFAVVDVWDALSSDRPYRPAWPMEKVREEIQAQSDKHFDPKVVEVFLQMLENKA